MVLTMIVASFFLSIYIFTFNYRYKKWGYSSRFINTIYPIVSFIVPFCFTIVTGDYIIEKLNLTDLSAQGIAYLSPLLITTSISFITIMLRKNKFKTKPSKVESIILDTVSGSQSLNSKKTCNIVTIISVTLIVFSILISFINGIDVYKNIGHINTDIQITGVSKTPEHFDKNGNKIDEEYSISYKIMDSGDTGTLTKDNFDESKLPKYYAKFKDNIESIYSATISVSQSIKHPDIKEYTIVDIEHN